MADWLVEPRDPAGYRSSSPLRYWNNLQVIDRYLKPGSWAITGPRKYLERLAGPGMGVVLSRDGTQVMSGQVTQYGETGDGNATITGWDDKTAFGSGPDDTKGRVTYPDPTKPITGQEIAEKVIAGIREDLILDLIYRNAGAGAVAGRVAPRLVVPTSLHRGGTVSITTKLDLAHVLVQQLAEQAGLNVEVIHEEPGGVPRLSVQVTPVLDVSPQVRFGPVGSGSAGVLGEEWTYTVYAPTMTTAVVGGTKPLPANYDGTEDTAADADMDADVQLRRYRVVTTTDPATLAWGRVAEGFVDASNTTVVAELDQAGRDALAETGERLEFSGVLADSPQVQYGREWLIGYRVGIDPRPGVAFSDIVREVQTTVQVQDGQQTEQVRAAVGWSRAAVAGTTTPGQQNLRYGWFRASEKLKVWG